MNCLEIAQPCRLYMLCYCQKTFLSEFAILILLVGIFPFYAVSCAACQPNMLSRIGLLESPSELFKLMASSMPRSLCPCSTPTWPSTCLTPSQGNQQQHLGRIRLYNTRQHLDGPKNFHGKFNQCLMNAGMPCQPLAASILGECVCMPFNSFKFTWKML